MTSYGFTGTQHGMTADQQLALDELLALAAPERFHHGDCIGADAQAHVAALVHAREVWIHPPTDDRKRAWCPGAAHVADPKPYIDRNHDIVEATDILIAAPRGFDEELRSGTWATIRWARRLDHPVTIIYPDGSIKETA